MLEITYKEASTTAIGWRWVLDIFRSLSNRGGVSIRTTKKKLVKMRNLNFDIAVLKAKSSELLTDIQATCLHPQDLQKIVSQGREDSYGCMKSGSDYQIACLLCCKSLASFPSEDVDHPERWQR